MARKHRDAMRVLVAEIVAGKREPGDQLEREVDLAERFNVSRGVARETIRALEERGLISVLHGRGATVTDPGEWNVLDADVLAVLLDSDRRNEILAEYLECRRILEVEAAGLAAERATEANVEAATDALRRMEESAHLVPDNEAEARFHEADLDFHQAIIAGTGNRALGGLVERIHAALLIARYPLARPEYRLDTALPEHKRILTAVASGDPKKARAAMSAHLDTILSYLEAPAQAPASKGAARTRQANGSRK